MRDPSVSLIVLAPLRPIGQFQWFLHIGMTRKWLQSFHNLSDIWEKFGPVFPRRRSVFF